MHNREYDTHRKARHEARASTTTADLRITGVVIPLERFPEPIFSTTGAGANAERRLLMEKDLDDMFPKPPIFVGAPPPLPDFGDNWL